MHGSQQNNPKHALYLQSAAADQGASLEVVLAKTPDEVLEAQKLRFNIFSEEYGADLGTSGVDQDVFDAYCDHLLVRNTQTAEVIGTYRILPPEGAAKLRCWYSETEFFMNRIERLRSSTVEVGRSCVHPDHRSGAAIMLLWSGIAQYMKLGGYKHLIGCASVSLRDGGHQAASLFKRLEPHLAEANLQVFPKNRLPIERLRSDVDIEPPPLVKGYLRLGAKVCGEPAWDPDFNTADFMMLLSIDRMSPRYARHFGFI
ncbi:MAG TPA: GNAT family N-acyltransferase [Limnobacter sp.]|uniref:GNAT family N-acetyltransferase n=1 Tax=Limnobacter sp. TaxID=2003368 RepID=UPI002EDA6EA9